MGEAIRRPEGGHTAEIKVKLSDEAQRELREYFARFPPACPVCGYTHPSALWDHRNGYTQCLGCGHILVWYDGGGWK